MATSLELLSLLESRRSPSSPSLSSCSSVGHCSPDPGLGPALQRGSTAGYCGHYFPRAQAQVKAGRTGRGIFCILHCTAKQSFPFHPCKAPASLQMHTCLFLGLYTAYILYPIDTGLHIQLSCFPLCSASPLAFSDKTSGPLLAHSRGHQSSQNLILHS